jgi:hypothetical protein
MKSEKSLPSSQREESSFERLASGAFYETLNIRHFENL